MVHSALLLERVIVALADAESVAEVVVVLVVRGWLLRVDATLGISRRVQPQSTRRSRGQACGAAVACEVAFGKYLNELVLTMALYGAGVANTSGIVRISRVGGRRIAGQAREHTLTEGSEILGAVLNALRNC